LLTIDQLPAVKSREGLYLFVHFLYTDELKASIASDILAAELVELANYYKLPRLRELVLPLSAKSETTSATSPIGCVAELFSSPMFADFMFKCSDGKVIHAHKAWLSFR
jgi:hypothetical protein